MTFTVSPGDIKLIHPSSWTHTHTHIHIQSFNKNRHITDKCWSSYTLRPHVSIIMSMTQIKVNQILYRPGQTVKIPGVWSSQNSQTIGIWTWYGCQPYTPAVLEAECARKDEAYEKSQWPHRESNPRLPACSAVPQPVAPPRAFCTFIDGLQNLHFVMRAARTKELTGLCTACAVRVTNWICIDLDEKSSSRQVLSATDRLHISFLEVPLSSSNLCNGFHFSVATAYFSCCPPT